MIQTVKKIKSVVSKASWYLMEDTWHYALVKTYEAVQRMDPNISYGL